MEPDRPHAALHRLTLRFDDPTPRPLEDGGEVRSKGKGPMETWLVVGRAPAGC